MRGGVARHFCVWRRAAYASRKAREEKAEEGERATDPALLGPAVPGAVAGSALRIATTEALFPAPWTVAARGVLPRLEPRAA